MSTVLRSIDFRAGDELLITDHAYNACRNALERAAGAAGARVKVAAVPFPLSGPDAVVEAVLNEVTPRTRLALIDHVTSPTALVFPVARLVAELAARGVDALVDAAHAPGMVPVNLDQTGAAYTTGNFHKWVCAPKGAAFLHVRRDRQRLIHPLVTSHGANSERRDRSRFRLEFDWTGTADPAPYLAVPEALRFLGSLAPGGLPRVDGAEPRGRRRRAPGAVRGPKRGGSAPRTRMLGADGVGAATGGTACTAEDRGRPAAIEFHCRRSSSSGSGLMSPSFRGLSGLTGCSGCPRPHTSRRLTSRGSSRHFKPSREPAPEAESE